MGARGKEANIQDARRIGLVRLSALGDVVNTLPALTALRRARPDAHIAWIVETAAAGLLEGHPFLDDVIVVNRKEWEASLFRPRRLPGVLGEVRRLAARLRGAELDAVIDFQGNLRSATVAWMTRAPVRVGLGRGHAKELSHLLANVVVELPPRPLHRVERALGMLRALGLKVAESRPLVPSSEAERERVGAFLEEAGIGSGPFAIIHPGTSRFGSYKQWPLERWAEVARRLAREADLPVVVTRGPGEVEAARTVADGAGASVAPELSLKGLGELCRRCRLFLSVDTGPMHLASAVGAPVVALFGPKDPYLYGPYFGPSEIVEKPLECRPCRRRSCDDPECMLAITPSEVVEAARRLLAETSKGDD